MKMTEPTLKENELAGRPCGLGGGGSWEHIVSRSATHLDDRAETRQCNDLVEQNGLSVFIRDSLPGQQEA